MRMTEQDELLIQRCLDDELSSEETRALMYRLNQLNDGWKTLACGFLQERAFEKSIGLSVDESMTVDVRHPGDAPPIGQQSGEQRSGGQQSAAGDQHAESLRVERLRVMSGGVSSEAFADAEITTALITEMPRHMGARRRQLHRWCAHPLTSLSLCTAIALVVGLLLPEPAFLLSGDGDQLAASNDGRTARDSTASADNSASGNTRLAQGRTPENSSAPPLNYRVQFQPSGNFSNEPMNIPVIRDREKFYEALRRNGQVTQQFLREFPWLETESVRPELKAVRVSLDDQHDVLIFMDDRSFGPPVQ